MVAALNWCVNNMFVLC